MKKPKMVLISSWQTACGIAAYAEYLVPALSEYFEVDVQALDQGLLRPFRGPMVSHGEKSIDEICKRIKTADVVNIQLEPGLFGSSPHHIKRRIKRIIDASNTVILTCHTFIYPNSMSGYELVRTLLNPFRFLQSYREERIARFYIWLARYLRKHKKDKYSLIVHTKREAKHARYVYGLENIFDYPLAFLRKPQRDKARQDREFDRKMLLSRYSCDENDILIGCFGFLTEYKGIHTAIDALELLPEQYKLLLFGMVHPQSIVKREKKNPYVAQLVEQLTRQQDGMLELRMRGDKYKQSMSAEQADIAPAMLDRALGAETYLKKRREALIKRVIFCGDSNATLFQRAINGCDTVLLPYLETGQTSSGPMALSLEMGKKIIVSHNKCNIEVGKYAKNCFRMFDIGNHLQLAQFLQNLDPDEFENGLKEYSRSFNMERRAQVYMRAFKTMVSDEDIEGFFPNNRAETDLQDKSALVRPLMYDASEKIIIN